MRKNKVIQKSAASPSRLPFFFLVSLGWALPPGLFLGGHGPLAFTEENANGAPAQPAPGQVVLSCQNCPRTTLTITWTTGAPPAQAAVFYSSDPNRPVEDYKKQTGTTRPNRLIPGEWINTAELAGLAPGTEYHVALQSREAGEMFSFTTAPAESEEIVFLVGADSHIWPPGSDSARRRESNRRAAAENPDFIMLAGDLWYADAAYDETYGEGTTVGSVSRWFDDWHDSVITADGRRIPLLPAEGNHDKEHFHERFQLPGERGYYAVNYGPDLTVITLNSGHGTAIGGAQTEWLEKTLQDNQETGWVIVQFHVSPYPVLASVPFYGGWERGVKEHWMPLFEKYQVDLVFFGHDHCYLRTYPLTGHEVDHDRGIVYLGAGSWNPGGGRPDTSLWEGLIAEADARGAFFYRCTLAAGGGELMVEPVSTVEGVGRRFVLTREGEMIVPDGAVD